MVLSYNQLRLGQKDRTYIYDDMRPTRQIRTIVLKKLIASHTAKLSEQQQSLADRIEPALQRDTTNAREAEIPLLNILIETAPALLKSYGTVWQKENQAEYDQFFAYTHQLAPKKRHYNMLTKQYNTRLWLFPWNIIAMTSGRKEENMFALTSEETQGVPAETVR